MNAICRHDEILDSHGVKFDPPSGTGQGAISRQIASNLATAGNTAAQIYCTGLGAVSNTPSTGFPVLSSPRSVTMAIPGDYRGMACYGSRAGLQGGYQVNVLVPVGASKGTAVSVLISVGGRTSHTVALAVQ
jgi:uncharacterized protein (TIGR03437 family)